MEDQRRANESKLQGIGRREFVLLAAGGLAGAALAGCAAPAMAPTPTAPPAAKAAATATPVQHPKTRVGAIAPAWTIQIVTMLPVIKGFLKDEGVQESEYKLLSPATNVAALLAGEVDFLDAMGSEEAMRVRSKGEQLFIIGGRVNMNTMAIYGAKGLSSLKDLKGKRMGISVPGSKTEIVAKAALRHAGMKPGEDILLIPSGSSAETYQALLAGRVDAAPFISAQIPALKGAGYPQLLHLNEVYKDYQSNVMVVMGKTIERYPATVKAFVKAMIRSYRFMRDSKNWPEIRKILDDNKIAYEAPYFEQSLELLRPALPEDGGVNLRGLEAVAADEKEIGTIDKSFDVKSLLRLEFQEQALKELGKG